MGQFNTILEIGFDKNGEADFRASCSVAELDGKRMTELRAIIPVAVWQMEELWRQLGPMSKEQASCKEEPKP